MDGLDIPFRDRRPAQCRRFASRDGDGGGQNPYSKETTQIGDLNLMRS